MDFENNLKIELARQRLRQLDVANRLNMPLSTFSSYLRGSVRAPASFISDCEKALQLTPGALRPVRGDTTGGR